MPLMGLSPVSGIFLFVLNDVNVLGIQTFS